MSIFGSSATDGATLAERIRQSEDVVLFENERFVPGKGWKKENLSRGDRKRWSDRSGKLGSGDKDFDPADHGFKLRLISEEDSWEYGVHFTQMSGRRTKKITDSCRRREWVPAEEKAIDVQESGPDLQEIQALVQQGKVTAETARALEQINAPQGQEEAEQADASSTPQSWSIFGSVIDGAQLAKKIHRSSDKTLFENERFVLGKGWKKENLLPGDRKRWSDKSGSGSGDKAFNPADHGFKLRRAEEDSWEYGMHFTSMSGRRTKKIRDSCRQREWVPADRWDKEAVTALKRSIISASAQGDVHLLREKVAIARGYYEQTAGKTGHHMIREAIELRLWLGLKPEERFAEAASELNLTRQQITPLVAACKAGQTEAARVLIDEGADPNVSCSEVGHFNMTPLNAAVTGGFLDTVKFLAEAGAVWEEKERCRALKSRGYSASKTQDDALCRCMRCKAEAFGHLHVVDYMHLQQTQLEQPSVYADDEFVQLNSMSSENLHPHSHVLLSCILSEWIYTFESGGLFNDRGLMRREYLRNTFSEIKQIHRVTSEGEQVAQWAIVKAVDASSRKVTVFVVFKGTTDLLDIANDLAANLTDRTSHGIEVHGAMDTMLHGREDYHVTNTIHKVVGETFGTENDFDVVLCGHSLGGGLAILTAAELLYHKQLSVTRVWTFGAPTVMVPNPNNETYVQLSQICCQFVVDIDPVPRMPGCEIWTFEMVAAALKKSVLHSINPFNSVKPLKKYNEFTGKNLSSFVDNIAYVTTTMFTGKKWDWASVEEFVSKQTQSIMKALRKHKALLVKVGPVGETILLDAKANGQVNHRYLRGTSDQVKAELENARFWNGEVTQGGESRLEKMK
jgi:hypothetical protein